MDEPSRGRRQELRLLLVTITVSAVALLLLARLRFPTPPPAQVPVTPPLERLAARATYDELASIVGDAQKRIAPTLLSLRLVRAPTAIPVPEAGDPSGARMTLAVRLDETQAVAHLPAGWTIDRALPGGEAVDVVASDEIRSMVLVRVARGPAVVPRGSDRAIDVPAYVAVADPTPTGATLRPVFLARADPSRAPRWDTNVYSLGQAAASPGTPLFALDGEFIGMIVPTVNGAALLAAGDLLAFSTRLARSGSIRRGQLGFAVQALTGAMAKATGAETGVVVSYVEPNGPAAGLLRVGDVITALGDQPVGDADAFATAAAGIEAGATLSFSVVRDGAQTAVSVATATAEREPNPALGLTMRSLASVGSEVVIVTPGSAAARAGLRSGDVITHLNGEEHPSPRQIERAWTQRSQRAPILGVRRGSQPLVLALP